MMENTSECDFESFRFNEKLKAVEEFEKELMRKNLIPDTDELLLRKYKVQLEYTGGVFLAMFISVFSVLFNFILFNLIIHI